MKLQRNVGVLKAVLQCKVQVSHFAKTCSVILELLITTDRQAGMTNVICAFFQPCVSGLPKICGLRGTWTCCVVPSVTNKLTHDVAWISGSVSCSSFESLFKKLKLLRLYAVERYIVSFLVRVVYVAVADLYTPVTTQNLKLRSSPFIRCRKTGR
jgi:hypothetical protein